MTARSTFAPVKQLIRDTFRQAWASGIAWMMLTGTAVCVMLCLSVHVSGDVELQAKDELGFFLPRTAKNPAHAHREGVETVQGHMTLGFGAVAFPLARGRGEAVHFIELVLAGGVAGTLGLLLALVWTAGFAPSFLEPSAAAVLLAKPVARWQLLLGKYLGVLTFLGVQVALFIAATWLALGVRTQVWDMTYWWCIPLLLLQFAIFYSFSVLLAVITRSTAACVAGSLLFWLLAWGINYGCVMARDLSPDTTRSRNHLNAYATIVLQNQPIAAAACSSYFLTAPEQSLPSFTLVLTEAGYWISPKPIDAGLILFNALNAQEHFEKPVVFQLLEYRQAFSPLLSILSCLAITAVLLALSAYEFTETDY